MSNSPTPGRPRPARWRPGVLASGLAALLGAAACDAIERRETLVLDTSEITLPAGARIHDVELAGAGGVDSIVPMETRARPGDVVRFTTTDPRTHALAFQREALAHAEREWLERTEQLRGPPLVSEGASWVIALEGAPPGRYPFVCLNHGATGVLLVASPE